MPPEAPPRKRWFRRAHAVEPVRTTRVCPVCNVATPARLAPGESCSACEAQRAWTEVGAAGPLIIDHRSIEEALQRRQGEAAGEPLWRRLLVWLPPTVSLGFAVVAGGLLLELLSARAIGPLGVLLDDMTSSNRWTLGVGVLAAIAGIVALVRARRRRHFRRLPILASHLLAIVIGASAIAIGGFHSLALSRQFGGQYKSMPPREPALVDSHVERIIGATVVILAPDADGDARNLAIGTGAIVSGQGDRAWIVTCSHVAMPYVAVGTWRRASDAQPVWVQLSDGREGKGIVRWTAPPPLDVALVELPIENPPEAVPIAPDASTLQPLSGVTFVPNPYRAGWKVMRGQLLRREPHRTPAGTYDLLVTDLPVIPGDSGSGLFDARGQLVGLNTWVKYENGYAHGISLPAETMRTLVDAIQRGEVERLDDTVPPPVKE